MNEYSIGLILFGMGICVSLMNSIAGGGSTLSLPLFLFLGIPVDIAIGTNRLGVLLGNVSSSLKLKSSNAFSYKEIVPFLLPLCVGALIGAYWIIGISEFNFKLLLIGVLIFSTVQTLSKKETKEFKTKSKWIKMSVFFIAGFYGGFVQAGMGFVLIAVLNWVGYKSPTQINGIKSTLAIALVVVGVIPFVLQGQVNYLLALFFGLGSLLGGYLGATFQTKVPHHWIKNITLTLSLILILKLCLSLN
jgi:uncharacterized membrane protein YfcA